MCLLRIIILLLAPLAAAAQISGRVTVEENGKLLPLPSANVSWEGSGIGTTTDAEGYFQIQPAPGHHTLTVSFLGYKTARKIVISRSGSIDFTLLPTESELSEIEVIGRVSATTVDLKRADLTYRIDDKELRKAACCNLSESFETNASVDVSFSDAVTGTKQIEMLGLAGKYALIQRENIPFARGLNASNGLSYIPGPFVGSIQLTKGLSSVLNGYESISGQINVEFLKPETGPRFLANAFVNQAARAEINTVGSFELSENLASSLLVHASKVPFAQDGNGDGFADMPTGQQLNFTNRYHWSDSNSGWEGQLGVSALQDDRLGGQMSFLESEQPADSLWGFDSRNRRLELFGKNGYVFADQPYRSIGFIYSFNYHEQEALFGARSFRAEQKGLYFNSIFQDIIGNSQHKYRSGLSLQAETVSQKLWHSSAADLPLFTQARQEVVPGAYFEYSYEPDLAFTLVAGLRADYNSWADKLYLTPRVNLRYMASENTTLRFGGGRGQRTANVISENLSLLASGRELILSPLRNMLPEIAWNSGFSLDQKFELGSRKLQFTTDVFYTWFQNKLIADLDYNRNAAWLLQAKGSRSLSWLSQIDYEILQNLDLRLAYKYLDSRDEFIDGLNQSYLLPKHRAFLNLGYATPKSWKFDATLNWFGAKRLPPYSMTGARQVYSPHYFSLNTQINKEMGHWEIFAGVDNLLDYKQDNPIVSADDPYSPQFDSNYSWGPIFGRNIYLGLYYKLANN